MCVCVCVCVWCVSGNACGYLISHPWEELHLTLFDLLKYGLMPKCNVMCSSLDPMEELTATPPYPSWSRAWAWVICPPHKLEILDPSLKLNVLSCQDQLNRMPLQ